MYRQVHTSLQDEPWFRAYPWQSRYVFKMLMGSPHMSVLGLIHRLDEDLAHDFGMPVQEYRARLKPLTLPSGGEDAKVLVWPEHHMLWLRRFTAWQGSTSPAWRQGVLKAINRNGLPPCFLTAFNCEYPAFPLNNPPTVTDKDKDTVTGPQTPSTEGLSTLPRPSPDPPTRVSGQQAAAKPSGKGSRYKTFDDVRQDGNVITDLSERFPDVDIAFEVESCEEWHKAKGKTPKAPLVAVRNWCKIAQGRADKTNGKLDPGPPPGEWT